jgi:hypothetical protein
MFYKNSAKGASGKEIITVRFMLPSTGSFVAMDRYCSQKFKGGDGV